MKINWPWRRKNQFLTLEKRLEKILQPIKPDSEFVARLRNDLIGKRKKSRIALPSNKIQTGLFIAGGLFSGAILIITGIRAIIALLGAIGMIQLKKQMDEQPSISNKTSAI